jgi:hypothetical protein
MWVYDVKLNENGEEDRKKGRLVALGCSQKPGVDFTQTFAPTPSIVSLRICLYYSVARGHDILQIDVKNAFLQGNLSETIYLHQPPGYTIGEPGDVLELNKPLYGLRQSAYCWNDEASSFLESHEYYPSHADACIFIKHTKPEPTWLFIHVDDIVTGGPESHTITETLSNRYRCHEVEPLHYILGMKIEYDQTNRTITFHPANSVLKALEKHGMQDCAHKQVPMPPSFKPTESVFEPDEHVKTNFSSIVGSLIYIALTTRPDISFATNYLSRFTSVATPELVESAKSIFRYLAGTLNMKLTAKPKLEPDLTVWSDASYAMTKDRKGITGMILEVFGGTVGWASKKQPLVGDSTTYTEIMAAAYCVREAMWAKKLLADLGFPDVQCKLKVDNQQQIRYCERASLASTDMKHIDIRFHFVREQIVRVKFVIQQYVDTKRQIADICTKALPKDQFDNLRSKIGLSD